MRDIGVLAESRDVLPYNMKDAAVRNIEMIMIPQIKSLGGGNLETDRACSILARLQANEIGFDVALSMVNEILSSKQNIV
jgi:hypothetical protein